MTRKRKELEANESIESKANLTGLPIWLQNPIVVGTSQLNHMVPINDSIPPKLLQNLEKMDILTLFPVQETLLDEFDRHDGDILVSASTGSGKTLAYLLPILCKLWNRIIKRVRCLIVVPTRELTGQIKTLIDALARNQLQAVSLGVVAGSQSQKHTDTLGSLSFESTDKPELDADILITTPGRLLDHLAVKPDLLNHLQYLVMDEADRLMNQYYQGWLETVLSKLTHPKPKLSLTMELSKDYLYVEPKRVKKLLFSATLSHNPAKLSTLALHNPLLITLGQEKYTFPPTLTEKYLLSTKEQKVLHLVKLLQPKTLVFVKSVQSAKRLAVLLNKMLQVLQKSSIGLKCTSISSGMPTNERKKALKDFESGKLSVLVCSDVVGRGIDLGEAKFVINYDIPSSLVTYVHRVGRTARALKQGDAISLVEKGQLQWFKKEIIDKVDRTVHSMEVTDIEKEVEEAYVQGLKELSRLFGHEQVEDVEENLAQQIESSEYSSDSDDSSSSSDSDVEMDKSAEPSGQDMAVDQSSSSDSDSSSDSGSSSSESSSDTQSSTNSENDSVL